MRRWAPTLAIVADPLGEPVGGEAARV